MPKSISDEDRKKYVNERLLADAEARLAAKDLGRVRLDLLLIELDYDLLTEAQVQRFQALRKAAPPLDD